MQQEIKSICFPGPTGDVWSHTVGYRGVSRISLVMKPGLQCDIPYIQVWKAGILDCEFCQHMLIGTFYYPYEAEK